MKLNLAVTILAVLLFSPDVSAEESLADRARLNLSNEMYSEVARVVESRLEDSGLSSDEVSEKIEAVANGHARCLVDFLNGLAGTESAEVLRLMAEGRNDSEARTEMGDGYYKLEEIVNDHKQVIEGCFLDVQQNLGIPGGPIFDSN